jgi:protoporphyrin/coproporphyrin ferrochelatase
MNTSTGILLTNIGSPDAPTPSAVRAYLKKFLTDKRVVEIPRWIWYPILYGIILPFRSRSSAKLYQKIWLPEGSPLTLYSQSLAEKLQLELNIPVAFGTHYGKPSIKEALEILREKNVEKIISLPLYPQYSATTTAAAFDMITQVLSSWRKLPAINFLNDYADHPHYIAALCQAIQQAWQTQGKPQHLLFSFHGIPQRCDQLGDPYAQRCNLTARLIAEKLHLTREMWSIAFQSRLGRAKWLSPYTDNILKELPTKGIKDLHVISPGFAVDCLETLEELAIRGKEQFLKAGGHHFHYIPALNDSASHVQVLHAIVKNSFT